MNTRRYSNDDYEFLRHEPCELCGSSNNVGVWLHKPTNKETKFCFTEGCPNNTSTASLYQASQPGSPLRQSWLDALRISANTAVKYRLTAEGRLLYFGYATPEGKLKRVKKRDYNKSKDDDYHFVWMTKEGETTLLYGMDTCSNPDKKLIITEGELDAPCAYEMTGINSVSIPNGCQGVENAIRNNYLWLKQFKLIYIVFDNDSAGQAAAEKARELIGYRARIVHLPEYRVPLEDDLIVLKDARDFRKYHFDSEFQEALTAADNSVQPFVWSHDDLMQQISDSYNQGNTRHYSTGIPELDRLCPIRLKELTLAFGSPGRGKSSLGRFIAKSLIEQGVRPYYMSFEEPPDKVLHKLSPLILGEPIYYGADGKVTNPLPDLLDKMARVAKVMDIAKIDSLDPDTIYDAIECAYVTHGCQFILLDHITWLLDSAGNPVQTARQVLHKLCELVSKYPIHIWAVSHNQPGTKPQSKNGQKLKKDWEEYEEPTQRDAQWSSGLEQLSYNIWGLKNPDSEQEPMRIYVLKSRFGGKKNCGKVMAYYQPDGTFLGASDAAKMQRNTWHDRSRGNQDSLRLEAGDDVAPEVLSTNQEMSGIVHPIPEQVGSEGERGGTLPDTSGCETEGIVCTHDTGGSGATEEVQTVRIQPGLYNPARSNNRSEGGNERRVPQAGTGVQEPTSSVLSQVQDRVSKPKFVSTPQKNKLPGLGRRTGHTLVSPTTTWEEFVAATAEGMVDDRTPTPDALGE